MRVTRDCCDGGKDMERGFHVGVLCVRIRRKNEEDVGEEDLTVPDCEWK